MVRKQGGIGSVARGKVVNLPSQTGIRSGEPASTLGMLKVPSRTWRVAPFSNAARR